MKVKLTPERFLAIATALSFALTHIFIFGFFSYVGLEFVSMIDIQSFIVLFIVFLIMAAVVFFGALMSSIYIQNYLSSSHRDWKFVLFASVYAVFAAMAVIGFALIHGDYVAGLIYAISFCVVIFGAANMFSENSRLRVGGMGLAMLYSVSIAWVAGMQTAEHLVTRNPKDEIFFASGETLKAPVVLMSNNAILISDPTGSIAKLQYVRLDSIRKIARDHDGWRFIVRY